MKIFYVFCVVLLMGWAGCKSDYNAPCRDQAVKQTFNFTYEQESKFPYRNYDTIGFVNIVSDTFLFYVDTVISFYKYKPSTIIGNPECPNDIDAYIGKQAQFRGLGNGISIWATAWKHNDSCEFSVDQNRAVMPISAIGDSTRQYYKDSLVLMNKTFYKVNSFVTSAGDSMLVNASHGLLYFTYVGRQYYQFKFNSK